MLLRATLTGVSPPPGPTILRTTSICRSRPRSRSSLSTSAGKHLSLRAVCAHLACLARAFALCSLKRRQAPWKLFSPNSQVTFSDCFHLPSTVPCRYTPQLIDLDHKLKPFIPDFIPAVGDIDAFLKVQMGPPKNMSPGVCSSILIVPLASLMSIGRLSSAHCIGVLNLADSSRFHSLRCVVQQSVFVS